MKRPEIWGVGGYGWQRDSAC